MPLLLGAASLRATSVVAPNFPALVAEAESIVRAQVVDVHAAWVDTPQGRVIKTFVTFAVQRRLKGAAPDRVTLPFLGGELDGQGMRVEGMPRFTVGEREFLFIAANGAARFCPLVALMHGRYRVLTDAQSGREYIARDDRVPLTSADDVQLPQTASTLEARLKSPAAALSPDAFETRIQSEITRRVQQP
jgi:hypothetical protein